MAAIAVISNIKKHLFPLSFFAPNGSWCQYNSHNVTFNFDFRFRFAWAPLFTCLKEMDKKVRIWIKTEMFELLGDISSHFSLRLYCKFANFYFILCEKHLR